MLIRRHALKIFLIMSLILTLVAFNVVNKPRHNVKASYEVAAVAQIQTTTTVSTTIPPTTITHTVPKKTVITHTTTLKASRSGNRSINWDAIAKCESGNNWSLDDGSGFYGGLQFLHSTWVDNGGLRYSYNAHQTSRENQIAIASTMSLSNWPICKKYAWS